MRILLGHNLSALGAILLGYGLSGAAPTPPAGSPTEYAAHLPRLLQNTGVWQFPVMQLVPTSNAHTYTLDEAPASVTIGLATGYLSVDTATLLTDARVLVRAVDAVTAHVTLFEFTASVLFKAAADYQAADPAALAAIFALGGAALHGKQIEITAPFSSELLIPNMGSNSIAVRSSHVDNYAERIRIAGDHLDVDLSNLHIWHRVWPRVIDGIINRDLGSDIQGALRLNDAYIHHGYGPTNAPWDTAAALPEYDVQRLSLTADVASAAYALDWNDPTNPHGGFLYAYGSASPIYLKLGDAAVVASASDTQINAYVSGTPQSPGWGAAPAPTHVAVLSPSGPQSINLKVNQPVAYYLASLFTWVGQNHVGVIEFQRSWLDSLADAIKPGNMPGCDGHIVDRCIFTAIYHDVMSWSIDGALDYHMVTRCLIQLPFAYRTGLAWADVCDPGDPHSDGDQVFSTSSGTIDVCIGAGCMFLPFKTRANVVPQADFFWSAGAPHPSYRRGAIIGNLLGVGGGDNNVSAETAIAYGNTAFSPNVPSAETSIGARGNGTAPTAGILARNISGKFSKGTETMDVENVDTQPGTLDALIDQWANRLLPSDRTAAKAVFSGKVGSAAEGKGFDIGAGCIDWQTEDPFSVIKWDQIPGFVRFVDQVGVPSSALTTSASARLVTGPIARTVTPEAGVEWRWATTTAALAAAPWLNAAAVVTPAALDWHVFVETRYTTPAGGLADTQLGLTVDGYTSKFRTVTDPAAFFTASGTGPYFRDPAAPYAPSGCDRWQLKAWLRLPASEAGYIFSVPSINIELELLSNASLRCNVKDGAGTSMFSASTFSGVTMPWAQWTFLHFDVDYVAQTASLTIDGTTVVKTFPSTPVGRPNGQPSILVRSNGTGQIAGDVGYLELLYNGVTEWTLQGAAAVANADAWKLGTDAT